MGISTILSVVVSLIHATSLILLSLLTVRLLRNLGYLRQVKAFRSAEQIQSRISVLVPARNEVDKIKLCLESLAQQDYPDYEILVLDDQSSDKTLEQIQQLARQFPQIHVLQGDSPPPPDWNGKSYACHRLAQQATGDWLLFTDADTVHSAHSIRLGMAQALHLNVDLLSAMPRQITKSWSEHLLVSFIMDFLPLVAVDLRAIWRGEGSNAIANGQYILIRKSAYVMMGGHSAIARALVDDFALATHFVQAKRPIAVVNGVSLLACRMYNNANDVWRGFSKNILLSLQAGKQWSLGAVMLFAWGFVSLFVLPYLIVIFYPDKSLALIEIIWLIGLRLLVAFVIRRPALESLFTAFSALGVMMLGLNAISLKLKRQPILWKERPYPTNH